MNGLNAHQPRFAALKSSPTPFKDRKLLAMLCLAICWGGFVTLAGCGIFSPDEDPLPPVTPPAEYPILSHPENVLSALELAYTRLDSAKVTQLYDANYTGSSFDMNGSQTDLFTHDDERLHIQALASKPGIRANLDLGAPNTWDRVPSDDVSHPEWAVIQIDGVSDYRIEIFDGTDTFEAVGAAGTFQEFAFTPTVDTTSPSDTLWKIVRWKETGDSQPDPPTP